MTTIWLGETRYGPLAPVAFQLGKYDAFTSTGLPIWSTSKVMRLSAVLIPETTGGLLIGTRGVSTPSVPGADPGGRAVVGALPRGVTGTAARFHSFGPLAAIGTPQRAGSSYQVTAAANHSRPPLGTLVITTGWYSSGATMSEPATS